MKLLCLVRFRAHEIGCWNFYIILWYGNSQQWSQRVSPCLWDFISSYSNMSTDSYCILKYVLEPTTKLQAANMSPVLWCLSDANGMAKSKTGKMTEMADWLLTAMICKLRGLQITGWIPRLFHSLLAQRKMVEIPIGYVCSQTIVTEVILTYIQTHKCLSVMPANSPVSHFFFPLWWAARTTHISS